jgi:hypothetical protein
MKYEVILIISQNFALEILFEHLVKLFVKFSIMGVLIVGK